MKKRVSCLTWWLIGMAVFLLNGCWLVGETPPVELTTARSDFKVAILLPGPANDKAWNQSGYEGLKLIEQEFKAETAFVERLEGPELAVRSREAAHRFAASGFDLVILHGGEFVPIAESVAREFPRTRFALSGTYAGNNSNLGAVAFRFEESGYLSGVLAALHTRSNKVAYIAGFDYPSYVEEGKLFEIGAKSIKPEIQVKIAYLQTWFDPNKARDTALGLARDGYDILLINADAPGLMAIREVTKLDGVYVIGHNQDQSDIAPGRVLTSVIDNVPLLLLKAATLVQLGRWEGKQYKFGMREDILRFAPFRGAVRPAEEAVFHKVQTDILTGSLNISTEIGALSSEVQGN
ncbi:MAG TPA: BMP family protein [Acidobacteriota bacterium]|nr:BMP family protein [Acidobacteriota bacterium]